MVYDYKKLFSIIDLIGKLSKIWQDIPDFWPMQSTLNQVHFSGFNRLNFILHAINIKAFLHSFINLSGS